MMSYPKFQNALDTLMKGNSRYAAGQYRGPDTSSGYRKALLNGQHPMAAVVACSDSRVTPEIIFDLGLGDLFVIRTAGNLVDDLELESIDFAVHHLSVPLVLILGHTRCGAVTAAAKLKKISPADGKIAHFLAPSIENAHHFSQDLIEGTVLANITATVSRLSHMDRFIPLIAQKTLQICGGIYQLESGKVQFI